jgi:competence protein ComEA
VSDTAPRQLVFWALAALLLAAAAWRLLAPGGAGEAAPPAIRVGAGEHARGRPSAVFVHVAGAVRRPGLYRVPAGSRVAAALERAGGPRRRADMTAVNLAAPVEDGQQVVVPSAAAAATRAAPGPGAAAGGGKLGLAAATVEQLEELDGIGPTLAKRIVEYRDAHGGFRSIEDLGQVDGIGEKRLEALREAVQP